MQQVRSETLRPDALPVVVEPHGNGAAEGHVDVAGRRAESGICPIRLPSRMNTNTPPQSASIPTLAFADGV